VPPVRMQDVAAHAGVSPRTVSNVVNGYVHVSPAMRARVQKSLDDLGYKMNYLARGLKSGRTGFIALVVPSFADAYAGELAQATVQAAAGHGLGVLVEATGADPATELKIMQEGMASIADGVLLSNLGHPRNAGYWPPPGFPVVAIGGEPPGPDLDHVTIDDTAAARSAVEHLIETGRRRIVMIGSGFNETSQLRYEGYRQAMAAARIRPSRRLAPHGTEPTPAAGRAETDKLLGGRATIPDAIFAYNDAVAMGVMRSLTEHGLRVPDDVAVAGFDDNPLAQVLNPPLTSVVQDLPALAQRAVDLLAEQIRPGPGPRTPRHEILACHLVIRESTAAR
jgi:DNA-binding LacI/PurR family transcriptional regulator